MIGLVDCNNFYVSCERVYSTNECYTYAFGEVRTVTKAYLASRAG